MFTVYPTQARNPACLGVCELIQQIHLFHLVLGQIGVPGIPGYPLVFFCNGKPDKPGGFLVRNMIYIHGGFDAIVNVICHIIVDS